MTSNSIGKLVFPLIAMLISLFLVVDLLASGGNAVAQVYRYCFFGVAIFGLLSPRNGFYLLIFFTAYLDFFKRLMIFDSGVSRTDLYFVLGIGPALISGIACSVLYSLMTRNEAGSNGLLKLAVSVLVITGVLAAVAAGTTKGMRQVADVVNAVIYMPLLFIVPALFPTPDELRSMLRKFTFIYFPAVFYMLIHWFRATFLDMNPPLFDWELIYLKSGLTIEIRQLQMLVFRPFGTFNSAANASMIFAMLIALLAGNWWSMGPLHSRSGMGLFRLMIIPLVLTAMFATYSRTGWMLLLAVLAAPILFRRRILTISFYAASIATFVGVVVASPYLLKSDSLNRWTGIILDQVNAGEKWTTAASLGSMNARLVGFEALVRNGSVWTPFGFKFAYANPQAAMDRVEAHDVITLALMKFGYIPLLLGGLAVGYLLISLHRFVYDESHPLSKSLGATCLSIAVVLVAGGTVNFAQFITFPVNFWIWCMFAIVLSLKFWNGAKKADREPLQADGEPGFRASPAAGRPAFPQRGPAAVR